MENCPCGSGKPYAECCKPFLSGEKAPTAEKMMRSRYTAFVKGRIDYIKNTVHPEKLSEFEEKSIRDWSENSEWQGLEILNVEAGGESDPTGKVEFKARYKTDGLARDHHEIAEFKKVDDTWFFVDGNLVTPKPFKRDEPKVGRNDPCPCGSGKKYKKCHGA